MEAYEQIREFWPDWEIEERIGKGSFGEVFRASRTEFQTTFYSAIKMITVPGDEMEVRALRLEGMNDVSIVDYYNGVVADCVNEISVLEHLKGSSHIVSIEDFKVIAHKDEMKWNIFIRMELLKSLEDFLAEKGSLTEDEVIQLGLDLCDALSYCAKEKIIHRDIKQENVFVSKHGDFKLGDFGIAKNLGKATSVYSQKGTYNYMAPEVYKGEKYGPDVDIYSLGILLYRLCNKNRMPFVDVEKQLNSYSEREEAFQKRISGEPVPAPCGAGKDFSEIILKACSYTPGERYQDAEQMQRSLMNLRRKRMRTVQNADDLERTVQIDPEQTVRVDPNQTVRVNPGRSGNSMRQMYGQKRSGTKEGGIRRILIAAVGIALILALAFGIRSAIKDDGRQDEKTESASTTSAETTSESAVSETSEETDAEPEESAAEAAEEAVTAENPAAKAAAETEEAVTVEESAAAAAAAETPEEDAVEQSPYDAFENRADADVPPVPEGMHYAVHYSEISATALADICANTESYNAGRPAKDSNIQINGVRHVGDIFMGRKASCIGNGKDQDIMNKLYNLYEVDMTYTIHDGGEIYQERFTSIYYRRYKEIVVEKDGSCAVDILDSAEPTTFKKAFFNSSGTRSIIKDILGQETVADVKDFLYEKNSENYYIEYSGQ